MVLKKDSVGSMDGLDPKRTNSTSAIVTRKGTATKNEVTDNICIEKIFCYELKNFLYVVGSSNCKSKHRVLKFDRKFKNNLVIYDNKRIMSTKELNEYKITEGFDYSVARVEPILAFGIVGFVRFLEGYYLILVVKRRCVAIIGRHCVYKIEDTSMLYIPNEDKSNSEEQRYLKIFNNVDLKSNFYFSYSYDLSNTLQYNLSPFYSCNADQFKCGFGHSNTVWDMSEHFIESTAHDPFDDNFVFTNPNMKFVWNEHLLSPMCNVHNDFFLYICHGFVSQAIMPITGRNLIITLIARRSKRYAGTRYMKRGSNCEGFPANDIETEQIVHDGNVSSFRYGLYTSFVQIRGSVPTYWSQNIAKMVPKPPINIDLKDPFYEAAGKHFNNLLYDYGSPIIVLNLVKRKEKKPQECILYNEFESAIEYLNQFVPKQHQIMLIGFDMARANKTKDQNVIAYLSEIALYTLKKTGFFQNRNIAINKDSGWPKPSTSGKPDQHEPIFQTGLTRVNCVDCLDRTNTAQFAIGKIALAHQLFTMGVIAKPELSFETDIVRQLEELYEDHGDTVALQYGGSQLVHRIKTYRKIAPLTSQSKDIMQSLSRYYSNAFSDSDKQNAINLFLGIYQANKLSPIWSQLNDYALHHSFALCRPNSDQFSAKHDRMNMYGRTKYTKWWSDEVALCLPRAAREFFKDSRRLDPHFVKKFYTYDWFFDVHRLQECVILADLFLYNMSVKKSKSYIDILSIKKLTNFRTQNRQSLVGIPLNTNLNDDSDPSDMSDCENDNIIIRFESGCQDDECEDVHDGAEYDFATANHEFANSAALDPESKNRQLHQNWLNISSRDFSKPSYERRIRSVYRKLEQNWTPNNAQCPDQQLYQDYLDYANNNSEVVDFSKRTRKVKKAKLLSKDESVSKKREVVRKDGGSRESSPKQLSSNSSASNSNTKLGRASLDRDKREKSTESSVSTVREQYSKYFVYSL